ncbi:hypothetical protein HHI36_013634 [Cryptolaemus montrouzieri]|uniref:Uncharacterized protein n=1 Tax=Cryptolaemus montrouzieri TaxID=559131 RepID=A0ABD2NHN9_9CUCU
MGRILRSSNKPTQSKIGCTLRCVYVKENSSLLNYEHRKHSYYPCTVTTQPFKPLIVAELRSVYGHVPWQQYLQDSTAVTGQYHRQIATIFEGNVMIEGLIRCDEGTTRTRTEQGKTDLSGPNPSLSGYCGNGAATALLAAPLHH